MQLLTRYFPSLSSKQLKQYALLADLYATYNQRVNVISRKDIGFVEERHILHALSIAKFKAFRRSGKVLDIGTGGGLPGLPLSIFYPKCSFLLVDSIGKKIRVVQEMIEQLKLTNVKAIQSRVEQIDQPYDYFVSRAVASSKQLITWTKHLKKPGGSEYFFLKGGDLSDELKEIGYKATVTDIKQYFKEPFFETKKIVWIKTK